MKKILITAIILILVASSLATSSANTCPNPNNQYTITAPSELQNLTGTDGITKVAMYINTNFIYNFFQPFPKLLVRFGVGNCWALSDFAAQVLGQNGYETEVWQGNDETLPLIHRLAKIKVQGEWKYFESSRCIPVPTNLPFDYHVNPDNYNHPEEWMKPNTGWEPLIKVRSYN
jgi:hypothetical protein